MSPCFACSDPATATVLDTDLTPKRVCAMHLRMIYVQRVLKR